MKPTAIARILGGELAIGQSVTVQGWVRTRRDSKAGLSFINLHDGSCFDALQIVAPGDLDNYADEVQRLSAGCAAVAGAAGLRRSWDLPPS